MKTPDHQEEKETLKNQHNHEYDLQLLKILSDYGQKACSYSFFLNGAAATAILGSGNKELYPCVQRFAWGALMSVVSIFLAFMCIGIYVERRSANKELTGMKMLSDMKWHLAILTSAFTSSLVFFQFGLFKAIEIISI